MNRRRRYKRQKRQQKKKMIRYSIEAIFVLFALIIGFTAKGTYAYFAQEEIKYSLSNLMVKYEKDNIDEYSSYSEGISSLYEAKKGDVVFHLLNVKSDERYSNAPFANIIAVSPTTRDIASSSSPRKFITEDPKYMWYKCIAKSSEIGSSNAVTIKIYKYSIYGESGGSTSTSPSMSVDKTKVNHYFITINSDNSLKIESSNEQYDNEILEKNKTDRSFYVYFYSNTPLSNLSVTAIDAVGDVKKTRKMRQLSSSECAEKGLTDTEYWYVSVGDDNVTKAEVELGAKISTTANLIFKDGSTTIKSVPNVIASKEKGADIYVRKNVYSEDPLNAMMKKLIVHYFDSTSTTITISPTADTLVPTTPESGSFDVGTVSNKWRTTDTFTWGSEKGFIKGETIPFSVYDSYKAKSYTYSSIKDNTELWIKEGVIYDFEPPDKANITLIIKNSYVTNVSSSTTGSRDFYYTVAGVSSSTSTVSKVNSYWTYTGIYQIPVDEANSKIKFNYQFGVNGGNSYGTEPISSIPFPTTTTETTYYAPNTLSWPNNISSATYVKIKKDADNNITITTNIQTYNGQFS